MKRLKTTDVLARCKGFRVAIYHDGYRDSLGFVGNVEDVPVSEVYGTYIVFIGHEPDFIADYILAFHVLGGDWHPQEAPQKTIYDELSE